MDKKQIIALYDQDQRRDVRYPDSRREASPQVVRHVSTAEEGEGVVIYSRLKASDAEAVIDEQMAYFEGIGQDFEWKLYDYDRPVDLKARLAAKGFEIMSSRSQARMLMELMTANA